MTENPMESRLNEFEERFVQLEADLADPTIFEDHDRVRRLSREQARIRSIVELGREWRRARAAAAEAIELAKTEPDPEMIAMAEEEVAKERIAEDDAAEKLRVLLLPDDPNDDRDVILEIRAGTGGDEAALFAADLLRMYGRYAERLGWKLELISMTESGTHGLKEVICQVHGDGVYAKLKFESGVHRVQRVPETESQGRIHTSAASVVALPEAEDIEIQIDEKELKIDVYRSTGPGGQSVNTTDSAVRITHIPSGLVVTCQDEKSQHKNRAKALKVLQARLLDRAEAERQSSLSETRRSFVKSGDRSEKVRTYNFPQGRITDHRINLAVHQLQKVLDGDLDLLTGPLREEEQVRRLLADSGVTGS